MASIEAAASSEGLSRSSPVVAASTSSFAIVMSIAPFAWPISPWTCRSSGGSAAFLAGSTLEGGVVTGTGAGFAILGGGVVVGAGCATLGGGVVVGAGSATLVVAGAFSAGLGAGVTAGGGC